MDVKEILVEGGMDWIHVAQDVMQWRTLLYASNVPSGFIKGGEFLD
jgi:hypothetical protein